MIEYTYEIISYDVLGNLKDGYEVNTAHSTKTFITINEDDSTTSIIKKLKDVGYLNKYARNSKFDIAGEIGYSLYVELKTLYPICELKIVEVD